MVSTRAVKIFMCSWCAKPVGATPAIMDKKMAEVYRVWQNAKISIEKMGLMFICTKKTQKKITKLT